MKTYLIKNSVDVYEDSFEEGEGDHVNYFDVKAEIKAETPLDALKQFFKNEMYFTFDEGGIIELDSENNVICYDNQVDESNIEVLEGSIEYANFKKGLIDLYVARSRITIFELVPVFLTIKNL